MGFSEEYGLENMRGMICTALDGAYEARAIQRLASEQSFNDLEMVIVVEISTTRRLDAAHC